MAKMFGSCLFRNVACQFFRKEPVSRSLHISKLNMVKVGEKIPAVNLYEGDPGTVVNSEDLCKNKVVVIFGVPGAFTPGCSQTHLPGYIDRAEDLHQKGVDEIVCVAVNDAFVMEAWGRVHNASGKVRMLADPDGSYTQLLGLGIDIPKLGGIRSKRYSMVVRNGVITKLNVEPDSLGLSCSLAPKLEI